MILATRKAVLLFLIFMIVAHAFSVWLLFYHNIWWIDIMLHTLGGAWVATLFFLLKNTYAPRLSSTAPLWFYLVLACGVVMLIGVAWEWFEYTFDILFAAENAAWRAQLGLPDTMGDLLADLIGGLVLSVYIISRERRNHG